MSTVQAYEPRSPRLARQQADQSPPIPLSLVFEHVLRRRALCSARRAARRVTLPIASTLYDGLRPAALFGALGGALTVLVLMLAPDVDVRKRGRLLGALANTGVGLEVSLEGTSDEVCGCPLRA